MEKNNARAYFEVYVPAPSKRAMFWRRNFISQLFRFVVLNLKIMRILVLNSKIMRTISRHS